MSDHALRTPGKPRGQLFVARVFSATLQQLALAGYERLSIPEIADLAGVNKTSIYRRWPAKTELVRAALEHALGGASAALPVGNLRDSMIAIAKQAVGFLASPVGRSAFQMLISQSGSPDAKKLSASVFADTGTGGPAMLLAQAKARNEISQNTDVALVLTTVAGAIMHKVFVEGAEITDQYLENLIDLVLFGATVQRGKP